MSALGIVHFGLGPIGVRIARLVFERSGLESVGAVDVDPDKVGRDLGDVVGTGPTANRVPIVADVDAVLTTRAIVAFHSTGSSLEAVQGQLVALMKAGLNVISTCEELSYPWHFRPELARALDEHAKARGVRLLGTGVNPGFVMDVLPLVLSFACQKATSVRVHRVVNASRRRLPLQKKIGAGLTVEEFRSLAGSQIRHVGLPESLAMVVAGLGWQIAELEDTIEPVIAERERRSAEITVASGRVAGVHQIARARTHQGTSVELDLTMAIDAEDEGDGVEIDGVPSLRLTIPGGVHGDDATAAVAVNVLPRLLACGPGLLTMLELPLPRGDWGP